MRSRYVFIMACGNPIVGGWTSVNEEVLKNMHIVASSTVLATGPSYFDFYTEHGHRVFLNTEAIRQGALVVEVEVDGGKD